MVSNFLIRFIFVWYAFSLRLEDNTAVLIRCSFILRYIPFSSRNIRLRSFFFSLAEMLRRWQWNFCMFGTINLEIIMLMHREVRVETEHLGNADAYRVGSCEYIRERNAYCLYFRLLARSPYLIAVSTVTRMMNQILTNSKSRRADRVTTIYQSTLTAFDAVSWIVTPRKDEGQMRWMRVQGVTHQKEIMRPEGLGIYKRESPLVNNKCNCIYVILASLACPFSGLFTNNHEFP